MSQKRKFKPMEQKCAEMLVEILGEGPTSDPARKGQAIDLLMSWSSAKSSVMGMLREVINLKYNDEVRCKQCDPNDFKAVCTHMTVPDVLSAEAQYR